MRRDGRFLDEEGLLFCEESLVIGNPSFPKVSESAPLIEGALSITREMDLFCEDVMHVIIGPFDL